MVPKEFFTLSSMLTLTGATGATFVIANGIQAAFNYNPKWLALVIAEVISLFGVVMSGGHGSDYFIGIVNGFLIYCTAAGATGTAGGGAKAGTGAIARGADDAGLPQLPDTRRRFLTSWF